ncbi:MAG: DNA polymerase III subunit alpha, partial [Chloroflexi bacterium]|nr:DNA polymerase III subunit alpha [Chloroflexota bacterium]
LSTHASGILITDKPLVYYTPLQNALRGEGLISQFCMEDVEAIHLLKLDVLGLSTMTVLFRAFGWIARTTGEQVTQESIPLDDPDTYALLCTGEVTGIFQIESAGMRRVLRDLQPSEFRDIVAVLSLYRPGPMQFIKNYCDRKFGREDITYRHPALEPILAETYGIIVYQEQIIRIARELAGYTAGEGDLMRRAVGKKKREVLEAQRTKFVEGAMHQGIPAEAAETIFEDIVAFADYGFNKSHAACYAVLTLQTGYLKAHYPVEFMTAMLSVESGKPEKLPLLITECRRLGIEVRPPSVNDSDLDFTIERADSADSTERRSILGHKPLAIRFGLGAIKNVGQAPASQVVEARGDRPFADLEDFARRVDLRSLNKRVLESLILAGALDCLGDRSAMHGAMDQILALSQELHRARAVGQRSLFEFGVALNGETEECAPNPFAVHLELSCAGAPLPQKQLLASEKELLGTYMSAHPLQAYSPHLDPRLTAVANIDRTMARNAVQVLGVLSNIRHITTKRGDTMAFAQLADMSGTIEITIFPRLFEERKSLLNEDAVLLVEAKVDERDEAAQLVVDAISLYEPPPQQPDPPPPAPQTGVAPAPGNGASRVKSMVIEVPLDANDAQGQQAVSELFDLLAAVRGDVPFRFRLTHASGSVELTFPQVRTAYSPQLEQQIAARVGPNRCKIDWA